MYQGEGPYPVIAESDFLTALAREQRDQIERCCERIGRKTSYELRPITPPRGMVRARYDVAAGSACVAQTAQLGCPHAKDVPELLPACRAAYRDGQLQTGEACSTDGECAQNGERPSVCTARATPDGISRTCQPQSLVLPRKNEPCLPATAAGPRCEPPLVCREDATCGLPERGEACLVGAVWGDTCAIGSLCDREGTERCVAPAAVGSPCESGAECESFACLDGACVEPVWGWNSCVAK